MMTDTVMSWEDWAAHDATALAEHLRKGDFTAAEAARQARAAIGRINPVVGAVIEVFDDVVTDPCSDGMDPAGAFAGTPFLMKDLGPQMKGRLQECGSLGAKGFVAPADSFLTTKMRAAGLNLLGRTTTPELGVCGSVENPKVYVTRNPWNLAYTSGGSSAGSAVAVATGAVPIAHATDGGGSIRLPAAMNGLIGLKPSRGVFSTAPENSDLTTVVSSQGCVTRSVRDTARFFDACRGGAPGEFVPFWSPAEPYETLIRRDPSRLRIAVSHEWGDYRATPHIVAELDKAARLLESLGHHVEWVVPEVDLRAAYHAQTECYIMNMAFGVDRLVKLQGRDRPDTSFIEPMDVKIWEAGLGATYAERVAMNSTFNRVSRQLGAFFGQWDIVLTPAATNTTHRLGTMAYLTLNDTLDVREWFRGLWGLYAYTPIANLCGIPGICLPMARHDNGLPLGIHALAAGGEDGLLLQLPRRSSARWAADGTRGGGRVCT